jgi:hypothetical protein
MQTNHFALRLPRSMLACRRTAEQFLQARAQGGSAQCALELLAKSGADVAEV